MRSGFSGILAIPGASLAILFILGVGRSIFIMVSGYGQSTVEYGVHWNFFVTLCCLKVGAAGGTRHHGARV